ATAASATAAPADAALAPSLLALADPPPQDDAADDSASDGSASEGDTVDPTVQTGGFMSVLGSPARSPSQAGASATPMSASAADLAAQMAAKVAAGSSRFQLQMNPLGLGRVDVSVSIGANRQLTAALRFADPQTASTLSAHAGELKTALEQAGFNVPAGGFDFTSSAAGALGAGLQGGFDPGSGSGGGSGPSGDGARMAAFIAGEGLAAGGASDTSAWTTSGDSRLDIRI
ncbi:flagellar hook-length control protein FliK, partial [Caulobacter sp. S45]|uniref:flagellar hook-length control protein FliK n=1 Tax=Caulobacter sp. S45 TaxID=1641861 RepID=UPI001575036C